MSGVVQANTPIEQKSPITEEPIVAALTPEATAITPCENSEACQQANQALKTEVVQPTSPTQSTSSTSEIAAPPEVDNFMAFVTEGALIQAERSFPISGIEDLKDPKTQGTPAIGVPQGTDLGSVFDLNALNSADAQRIQNGERPKEVTFQDGQKVKVIYIPASTDEDGFTHIDVRNIPDQNFLIFLPHNYIVATSNSIHREAYPHDSSYVVSALIRHAQKSGVDAEVSQMYLGMARDMLDNFWYETQEFGFPLNGNRGYYLTRSQTNNIPTNVWEYYEATQDDEWLEDVGLPMATALDEYWNSADGQVEFTNADGEIVTGNRWIAHGEGPCQEVWESHGTHKAYYFRVLDELVNYAQTPDGDHPEFAQGFDYDQVIQQFSAEQINEWKESDLIEEVSVDGGEGMEGRMFIVDSSQTASGKDEPIIMKEDGTYYTFTPSFYTSDRAARVSGYDNNHLYGPFNAFTSDFIPAAHNIQLYSNATSIAEMQDALGNENEAINWNETANERKELIMETMWNEEEGMIFDYNAVTGEQRTEYPFASSCYAIWAGLFDVSNDTEREQLMDMVNYMEDNLEGPNGLYASGVDTGMHWDAPFSWPIQQGMVVDGLRDYTAQLEATGFTDEASHLTDTADRIALKYLKVNYRHWVASQGEEIQEKVGPDAGVFTGYENGDNYTWNLAAVWDLYDGLTDEGQEQFHKWVKLIK